VHTLNKFLISGQWDVNRSFSILAEFGFGKRKSQMLNLTYRFQERKRYDD
jgi:hypothetical protein